MLHLSPFALLVRRPLSAGRRVLARWRVGAPNPPSLERGTS